MAADNFADNCGQFKVWAYGEPIGEPIEIGHGMGVECGGPGGGGDRSG